MFFQKVSEKMVFDEKNETTELFIFRCESIGKKIGTLLGKEAVTRIQVMIP